MDEQPKVPEPTARQLLREQRRQFDRDLRRALPVGFAAAFVVELLGRLVLPDAGRALHYAALIVGGLLAAWLVRPRDE